MVLWDVVSVLARSVSGSPLSCKCLHFSQTYKMTLVAPWFSQPCALRACYNILQTLAGIVWQHPEAHSAFPGFRAREKQA